MMLANIKWVIISLFLASWAWAEPVKIDRIQLNLSADVSLKSLVDTVYKQHPSHHNAHAQQAIIDANLALTETYFSDSARVSLNHQNDVMLSGDGLQEWEAMIEAPLWTDGQKQQQRKVSKQIAAELPAYQQQIRLDASEIVRTALWAVIVAQSKYQHTYQQWHIAQQLELDVIKRVDAGDLAGSQQLLAKTNTLEMKASYFSAEAELKHVLEQYTFLTGSEVVAQNYQEIISDTVMINSQHPQLKILEQKINTLRTQQDFAIYEGIIPPEIAVGIRREREDFNDKFNHSIGVGVNFILQNKRYSQTAVARIAKELADVEISYQQREKELKLRLKTQIYKLNNATTQLAFVNEQNDITQRYLEVQQHAFDLGEIDLVSVLRSQTLANKALSEKHQLEIEIQQLTVEVNQAVGEAL